MVPQPSATIFSIWRVNSSALETWTTSPLYCGASWDLLTGKPSRATAKVPMNRHMYGLAVGDGVVHVEAHVEAERDAAVDTHGLR